MKKIIFIVLSLLLAMTCFASIPKSLIEGSATYQEVLTWSKLKMIRDVKGDISEAKNIQSQFPVILDESCGDLKLIFIKETAQCGNINCKFLVFSEVKKNNASHYRYMNEIDFAAKRLFCYKKDKGFNYYFVTSEHATNAESVLNLYHIVNNTFVHLSKLKMDYTHKTEAKFSDGLWEKEWPEAELLNGFKVS